VAVWQRVDVPGLRTIVERYLAVPTWLRAVPPGAVMAVIWWLSSRTFPPDEGGWSRAFLHNGCHVFAFGTLGLLLLAAFAQPARIGFRHGVAAVVVATLYGIVDELHQRYTPGRTCSVADMLADGSGAALACSCAFAWILDSRAAGAAIPWLALLAVGAVATATWTLL